MKEDQTINKAYNIAVSNLEECLIDGNIIAGPKHYSQHWARDALFATFGLIARKDERAKQNIELFLDYTKDGQVPLRVGDPKGHQIAVKVIKHALGFETKKPKNIENKPTYASDAVGSVTVDQNSLAVIAAHDYWQTTQDHNFRESHLDRLINLVEWNLDQGLDYAMIQPPHSDWVDSLAKRGKVLYTNALHFHSLNCLTKLIDFTGNGGKYEIASDCLKGEINKDFWNRNFYTDWIDTNGKRNGGFDTAGNMLAIVYGLADEKRVNQILDYMTESTDILNYVPCLSNDIDLPKNLVAWHLKPIGLRDYHIRMPWSWLSPVAAVAMQQASRDEPAKEIINSMGDKIIEHNDVYEVYERDGTPLNRSFYKSEQPFAWASGLFIWACHEIYPNKFSS